jgi:hypothetical protein
VAGATMKAVDDGNAKIQQVTNAMKNALVIDGTPIEIMVFQDH